MRVLFLGSAAFSIKTLDTISKFHDVPLVITQSPRPAGRKRKLRPTPVAEFAISRQMKLLEVQNVNSPEVIDEIKKIKPDVAIVVAFGQFLKNSLLSTIDLGFFNVHASLLPKYRGAAPIQYALLNGESETGVTLFKINEGMDSGMVASFKRIKIDPLDSFDVLSEKLSEIGAQMVKDFLENPNVPLKKQEGKSSKAPKISIEDTFIDWNKTAEEVGNKIRAFDSTPGARTRLGDAIVKLFGFKGISKSSNGKAGEILNIHSHALIACGKGAIMVEKIQFPSKKVITFDEAKNGRKISNGSILGT